MKRHTHLLSFLFSGVLIATVLSLAYIFFGSWDLWTPTHLWARILFYPGVAVGNWWGIKTSSSLFLCYSVGVGTMGVVGGIIGLALYAAVRSRPTRKTDKEPDRREGQILP
jgi:hypothetical protein